MRLIAITIAALAFTGTASAHIIGSFHGKTLKATVAYQEKQLAHTSYVCARGTGEVKHWHCLAARWVGRELAESRSKMVARISPASAICLVFGGYCQQALAVARCESGLSVYATNGQYLGLFQMGDYARSTYGHSSSAYGQARAAYAYFRDSGSDWSPWECKP